MPNAFLLLQTAAWINIGLLIFNMLPIYPLDGGQILRSLLWFVMGRARSLMAVTVIGFLGVAEEAVVHAGAECVPTVVALTHARLVHRARTEEVHVLDPLCVRGASMTRSAAQRLSGLQ